MRDECLERNGNEISQMFSRLDHAKHFRVGVLHGELISYFAEQAVRLNKLREQMMAIEFDHVVVKIKGRQCFGKRNVIHVKVPK